MFVELLIYLKQGMSTYTSYIYLGKIEILSIHAA